MESAKLNTATRWPKMSETLGIRFEPFRFLGRSEPVLRDDQEIKLQREALAVDWTPASTASS